MATTKDYLQYILDQISDLDNITYRQMMGEYILYSIEKSFDESMITVCY
jgi:TfoX/Sxy family transcriptional regulator of competence genes